MKESLFKDLLSPGLEANLERLNPWWRGLPQPQLPPVCRWAFPEAMQNLKSGLTKITVLRGPRQIGKSTLIRQMIEKLLEEGIPAKSIFLVQYDELPELLKVEESILRLIDWFEKQILCKSFNEAARDGQQVYIFLDEVQNLDNWAPQLKFLVDSSDVRMMVTGSSALRIEHGRDSLAGRIRTLEMGPLLLREILEIRGEGNLRAYRSLNSQSVLKEKDFWLELREFGQKHHQERDRAFQAFSQRGAYPVAHAKKDTPWEELADLLTETVIRRAIQHDLRTGPKGRKRDEHLLEEVFRLACRYIGQSPRQSLYLDEIKHAMNANIGWQRIWAYLKFLDITLLIRLIEPLELRLKRKHGPSKLCLCDHSLRAAWLQEVIPMDEKGLEKNPHLRDLAGHVAESTAGYFFKSMTNLDIAHFPERGAEPEVDFVLIVGEQRIPVEIKYRTHITWQDTRGLRSFIEKIVYNAPFGVLVTQSDEVATDDPRLVSIPLASLLLMR